MRMGSSRCSMVVLVYASLIVLRLSSLIQAQDEVPGRVHTMGKEELASLLNSAAAELKAASITNKERSQRWNIVRNVATVKAYFPHVMSGPPEYRNPKYWGENDDGFFVPKGRPTDAIKDLWSTVSGVRCHKLSSLVMLKALIDVSNHEQLKEIDTLLAHKVIPSDLEDEGVGLFFDRPDPKQGETFQASEFLPGDEVWFDNPYFDKLSRKQQSRYRGQEGHHVFYVGDGKLMDMYSREPVDIEEFRESFLRWASVRLVAKEEDLEPKASDFQIKSVRRVKADCLAEKR